MNLERHLLRLAGRMKLALALTLGLGAAGGVFTVLQAGLLSQVISLVFLGESAQAGPQEAPRLMALLLAAILVRLTLTWCSELSAGSIALRIREQLREAFYQHIENLGPSFAGGERTGELSNTALEGIEALDAYFSQYLPQLALAAIVPLLILCFVFPVDWLSGLVLALTAPLIPIFMILIGSVAQTLTQRQWRTLSRMSAYFLDLIQGLTALKILGRSRAQFQVLEQVNDSFRQTTMSVLRVTFLSALVLELVSTLSTAVVAVEVGLRLLYGRLAFEQALFVLILAPEFYLPLRMLGARFHAGMAGSAAARRIYEVFGTTNDGRRQTDDSRPKTGDYETIPEASPSPILSHPSHPGRQPSAVGDLSAVGGHPPAIALHSVSYSYPGERHALHNVSFQIAAGQKVALVGPSGGGKSTIAGLLLGFLQPQQGSIDIDGYPLGDLPAVEWRSRVAWVPQAPHLFQGSLAANLRLANPDASQEQLEQAARLANLHVLIEGLPDGYDTLLGEGGIGLSGGQAQRLALARAFLKDAPFLILDEATANLDPEQEALVQQALQRLLVGRTVLIIAHRLNTIRQANHILVLDQGRVVEAGDHALLLKQDGLYRKLAGAAGSASAGEEQPPEFAPGPVDLLAESTGGPITLEVKPPVTRTSPMDWASASLSATLPGSESRARQLLPQEQPAGFAWRDLKRLLRYAAPYSGWAALSVLAGSAAIACAVGLMATSAYLLSAAALQPSIAELQVAIVGVRFFGIGRGLFRYLERNLSHEVTFRLLGSLRLSFYRALEPLAPARLQQLHSGDLLARIHGDIAALENFYVRILAPPLTAILITAGISLWLGSFDLRLALALVCTWLLAGLGLPLLIHLLGRKATWENQQARVHLHMLLVDSFQGMADLAIFDLAGQFAGRFQTANRRLAAAQRQLLHLAAAQTAVSGSFAHLGMWLILLLAIPLVRSGEIAGVYLASLALAALAGYEAISPLPQAAQHLENSLQSARRLFEIIEAPPEVHEPEQPIPVPDQVAIEWKAVRFAYPPRPSPQAPQGGHPSRIPQPTLEQISFCLTPGRRLAIVGPSGAGKSTLASLLLRFWEPQSGEFLVRPADNQMGISPSWQSVSTFSSYDLRRRIGMLSQHTYLFAASLQDNLRLAQPKATLEEIEAAARRACLQEWIETLPEGYATWIGEQGLHLSAGQRQRLAIARLLLQNPSLTILDEPVANLDTLTAAAVLRELLTTDSERSLLLITHRLAGLETFDEILVLRQGRIEQRGSFAVLLEQPGYFRQMWRLQASCLPDQ